jgi:uncharacterized protein (DUF2147 family)
MPRNLIMKRGLASFAGTGAAAIASSVAASPLDGLWQNRNGTVVVEVRPCGANLCGIVVEAHGQALADARPRRRPASDRHK